MLGGGRLASGSDLFFVHSSARGKGVRKRVREQRKLKEKQRLIQEWRKAKMPWQLCFSSEKAVAWRKISARNATRLSETDPHRFAKL